MSLLEGLQPPSRKRGCRVATEAAKLDKKDTDILLNAIKDPAWGLDSLSRALEQRGILLSRSVLERHRKGTCPC